jgi:TPR repeat protein
MGFIPLSKLTFETPSDSTTNLTSNIQNAFLNGVFPVSLREFANDKDSYPTDNTVFHPTFLDCYGWTRFGTHNFWVIERVDCDLRTFLSSETASIESKMQLVYEVAVALRHLHSIEWVYPSLNITNIFVIHGHIKMADVRLIKSREMIFAENLTSICSEFLEENANWTQTCDVYAFGLIIAELVTGQLQPVRKFINQEEFTAALQKKGWRVNIRIPSRERSQLLTEIFRKFKLLGDNCFHVEDHRPTMNTIVGELEPLVAKLSPESVFVVPVKRQREEKVDDVQTHAAKKINQNDPVVDEYRDESVTDDPRDDPPRPEQQFETQPESNIPSESESESEWSVSEKKRKPSTYFKLPPPPVEVIQLEKKTDPLISTEAVTSTTVKKEALEGFKVPVSPTKFLPKPSKNTAKTVVPDEGVFKEPVEVKVKKERPPVSEKFLSSWGDLEFYEWVPEFAMQDYEIRKGEPDAKRSIPIIRKLWAYGASILPWSLSVEESEIDSNLGYTPNPILVGIQHFMDRNYGRSIRNLESYPQSHLAQFFLGLIYTRDPSHLDLKLAFSCLKRSSELGNANADVLLGNYYENGIQCEKDPKRAFQLYAQAADFDNTTGMYHLATCFENGIGCEPDPKKSAKWFVKAQSMKQNPLAIFRIGLQIYYSKNGEEDGLNKLIESHSQGCEKATWKIIQHYKDKNTIQPNPQTMTTCRSFLNNWLRFYKDIFQYADKVREVENLIGAFK